MTWCPLNNWLVWVYLGTERGALVDELFPLQPFYEQMITHLNKTRLISDSNVHVQLHISFSPWKSCQKFEIKLDWSCSVNSSWTLAQFVDRKLASWSPSETKRKEQTGKKTVQTMIASLSPTQHKISTDIVQCDFSRSRGNTRKYNCLWNALNRWLACQWLKTEPPG